MASISDDNGAPYTAFPPHVVEMHYVMEDDVPRQGVSEVNDATAQEWMDVRVNVEKVEDDDDDHLDDYNTSMVAQDHVWGIERVRTFWQAMVYSYCPCVWELPGSSEASKSGWKKVFASFSFYIWVVSTILLGVELAVGGFEAEVLVKLGAKYPYMISRGQVWRLITCIPLSGTLLHYAANTFALLRYSMDREYRFGRAIFIEQFLMGQIAGGVASSFYVPTFICVGCSPGLMAVFGAWVVDVAAVDKTYAFLKALLLCCALVGPSFLPTVDTAGHLAGILVGFLSYSLTRLNKRAALALRAFLYLAVAGSVVILVLADPADI